MTARRFALPLAAGLVLAVVGLAPAAATPKRPLTFTGSCKGTGTVSFNPPLTNTPRSLTQHARGPLACTGTLVDRRGRTHKLTNTRVIYDATESGDNISCALGIDGGTGALRFRRGPLAFTVQERRAAAVVTLTYTGARGGSATATATAGGDPAAAVQKCAGSGIKLIPASIDFDAGNGISG